MIKQLLLILFILLINQLANAQCTLNKTVVNGITITETAETYIYNRHAKQYNAMAITAFTKQKLPAIKIFLKVKYTTTNGLQQPKFLYIKFRGAETITAPLRYMGNIKSDNAEQPTKTYQIELTEHLIDRLSVLPAQSVGILSSAKTNLKEIAIIDSSMFQQLLNCFKVRQ